MIGGSGRRSIVDFRFEWTGVNNLAPLDLEIHNLAPNAASNPVVILDEQACIGAGARPKPARG